MVNRSVLRFWVQARPGLRLVAYASESATGCVYEIVFTFYGIKFPLPHLDMPGLGQGFKVTTGKKSHTILIEIRNTQHIRLGETSLNDETIYVLNTNFIKPIVLSEA